MDPTLNVLEEPLDDVKEVAPMPGGAGEVALKSGRKLDCSRRRFKDLLDHLAGETLP